MSKNPMIARRWIKKKLVQEESDGDDYWCLTYEYEYCEADFLCHLLGEAPEMTRKVVHVQPAYSSLSFVKTHFTHLNGVNLVDQLSQRYEIYVWAWLWINDSDNLIFWE